MTQQFYFWELCSKKPETLIRKNIRTPMFPAMLSTTTKIWKQPKCPSVGKRIKKAVVHLHDGILLGHQKEGNLIICDSMDGPGECYAE